jgi:hypothetical protein
MVAAVWRASCAIGRSGPEGEARKGRGFDPSASAHLTRGGARKDEHVPPGAAGVVAVLTGNRRCAL